jgi:hypothetical protein
MKKAPKARRRADVDVMRDRLAKLDAYVAKGDNTPGLLEYVAACLGS